MARDGITFGWFLPSSGDAVNLSDPKGRIPTTHAMLDEVVDAVDSGGFKYLLIPVNTTCWEAARTFSSKVMPLFEGHIADRLPAVA